MRYRVFQSGFIIGALLALWPLTASASLISQGYAVTSPVPIGALVALSSDKSGNAEIATLKNQDRLFGVAVVPSASLISLSAGNGEIQVATSGSATVLVSTENGAIHRGDHLAVSTIAGVAMKANPDSRTIGTASDDFSGTGVNAEKRKLDTSSGTREVSVGQIPIDIAVGNYKPSASSNTVVPAWLQNISNTVAGKPVSPLRAIIATTILVAAIISVSVLLYGSVRTSIISIGRNPLAKSSVFRGLTQVMVIVILIMGIASAVSYLVVAQ